MQVRKLNHIVLTVRDLDTSVEFYRRVFDFEEVARAGGRMAFMRARGSANHHDIGFFQLGPGAAAAPPDAVGLFHAAWQVDTIEELAEAYRLLDAAGCLEGASDHGASKSVYGRDPDGHEFEIMFMVPRERWGEYDKSAPTRPLDLAKELAAFGSST